MASLSAPIVTAAPTGQVVDIRVNVAKRRRWDVVFALAGLAATSIGVITLLALFIDLMLDGYSRLTPEFFWNFPSRRAGEAGILSAWVGTCLVMLVTAVIGVPLAVSAGIYLEEYAPKNWVTAVIEINVSNLAAVPSIVYGLLALGLFVYALGFGQSILSAGLTLALMIMPIIVVATREAVRAVPHTIREAAYAVGATRWQVTRDHVLPYSIPGIATGVIIGLARAIGETAPLITIGALTFIAYLPDLPVTSQPPFVNFNWLWSGFTVLPIQMFNWVSRPGTAFHANAAAAGVVIVALTLAMNGFAIWLRYRLRKRINW